MKWDIDDTALFAAGLVVGWPPVPGQVWLGNVARENPGLQQGSKGGTGAASATRNRSAGWSSKSHKN